MVQKLTEGPIALTNLRFGLPLALGMASHGLFNLVDLKLVGFLGRDAVAAIHLGSLVNFIPLVLANGITIGAAVIISRLVGAGRRRQAGRVSDRILLGLTLTGLVLGAAGYLAAEPLVRFQNARGEALRLGVVYLQILSLGTVTMFVLLHVSAVLRAAGSALRPVLLLAGANILNLVLDLFLIFGWEPLGIEPMGVLGAAWGTVLGRGTGALAGLALLAAPSTPIKLGAARLGATLREFGRAARLGIPQSCQVFLRVLAVLYMTRLAGEIGGAAGLAVISLGTRMDMVLLFFALGWGTAATTAVGQNLGAAKRERARRSALLLALYALAGALLFALLFAWQAQAIVRFFLPQAGPALVAGGRTYFLVMVCAYPAAALGITLAAGINGAGVVLPPLFIDAALLLGLFIPFTSTLATLLPGHFRLAHLWWTTVVVQWMMALCYYGYFRRGGWLRRKA